MQRMVMFHSSRENRDVAVNPANVLFVCHYEPGVSALHFSKECFVRVRGDLADVVHRLELAQGAVAAPSDAAASSPEAQSRAH